MKLNFRNTMSVVSLTLLALTACSQDAKTPSPDVTEEVVIVETVDSVVSNTQDNSEYVYTSIDDFSPQLGEFVGLTLGENFDESLPKINAVFLAYDGHAEPTDIRMENNDVEAGWTEILVTQEGLMDGTVAAQQLLAIYDENDELVTYGMRIKCHIDSDTVSEWQKVVCE